MNPQSTPESVVQFMMQRDYYSQWLGIEVLEIKEGFCRLKMLVRKEMLNGFGIVHGGVSFALADSAFAFASNSYGELSVSLSSNISYPKAAKEGEILIAEAKELSLTRKSATYDVTVRIENTGETVAFFRGTVYRTGKPVIQ